MKRLIFVLLIIGVALIGLHLFLKPKEVLTPLESKEKDEIKQEIDSISVIVDSLDKSIESPVSDPERERYLRGVIESISRQRNKVRTD